ncbi:hypothetical protein NXT01_00310 [Corynebacterium sp. ES2775-CONJ]|nr:MULTISPECIES: hypothetical protein [unclassified Corynebacterium]MCS4489035.1 hypothetical protein [Corynebacterium sp. ES2775-CONJ]MCS4490848.1 hypothetical protein [Corynebacterium sp. ES2715-CONJ3]MCS4531269.1 hypothetical protein [Corynebacterium sp. ES2730-CONJ]
MLTLPLITGHAVAAEAPTNQKQQSAELMTTDVEQQEGSLYEQALKPGSSLTGSTPIDLTMIAAALVGGAALIYRIIAEGPHNFLVGLRMQIDDFIARTQQLSTVLVG